MNLLILGGTGFIGQHQVRYALACGHRVTLFNRGMTPAPGGDALERLVGDRNAGDYDALVGRKFDACIDNATLTPRWVRDVAQVLKGNIGNYTFISTTSVYASDAEIGADERAERQAYDGADAMAHTPAEVRANMTLYGPLKAFCEDEAERQFPGMTAIIRPGLIVGPGDESDRFTYWPVRIARAQSGERVLMPPRDHAVQFIDVRDVAEWSVRVAEAKLTGAFNAKGPDFPLTFGAMVDTMRAVTGSRAEFCHATNEFLSANNVRAWFDLPVWIPDEGDTAGAHRRSVARAIAAGLTYRPLANTVADTLSWWELLPENRRRNLKAGMTMERESAVLEGLG